MKNRDPRMVHKRDFQCVICGMVVPATKWARKTAPGHIKHMWCCWCSEITEHVQIGGGERMTIKIKMTCNPGEIEKTVTRLIQLERKFSTVQLEAQITEKPEPKGTGTVEWTY